MLKFEGIAQNGNKIRAYDFEPIEGRPDRFIEGFVIDCHFLLPNGVKCYEVKVTKDTLYTDDETNRVTETIFVPFETTFDFDNRVQLIS